MRTLTLTPAPTPAALLCLRRWLPIVLGMIALAGLLPPPAEAQGRRARLSRDVQARLAGASDARTEIIIDNLPAAEIKRLASKHGARVARHLSKGAVLEVDGKALRGLADDAAVPHIAGNHKVAGTMAIAIEATGADQLQDEGRRRDRYTGRGVGIAVIDSGISMHSSLAGRVVAS